MLLNSKCYVTGCSFTYFLEFYNIKNGQFQANTILNLCLFLLASYYSTDCTNIKAGKKITGGNWNTSSAHRFIYKAINARLSRLWFAYRNCICQMLPPLSFLSWITVITQNGGRATLVPPLVETIGGTKVKFL